MTINKIRNFQNEDIPALMRLQEAYAHRFSGAKIVPSEVYGSPAFHGGEDVFCLSHPNGQLLAYAAMYPKFAHRGSDQAHVVWAEIKADPILMEVSSIKNQLFDCLLRRLKSLTEERPDHPSELCFQYFPQEEAAIAYICSKGAQLEKMVYQMERSLKLPIPAVKSPQGIEIRYWRMENTAEQAMYVQARNECFPEAPIRLDEWIYFMQSTEWALGTQIAAFEDQVLVGSLTAYWNEVVDPEVGYSEDIFVRPAWRGRKIAPAMIYAALLYLQEHGLRIARLEVRASNWDAIDLYKVLGYEVKEESGVYVIRSG